MLALVLAPVRAPVRAPVLALVLAPVLAPVLDSELDSLYLILCVAASTQFCTSVGTAGCFLPELSSQAQKCFMTRTCRRPQCTATCPSSPSHSSLKKTSKSLAQHWHLPRLSSTHSLSNSSLVNEPYDPYSG